MGGGGWRGTVEYELDRSVCPSDKYMSAQMSKRPPVKHGSVCFLITSDSIRLEM